MKNPKIYFIDIDRTLVKGHGDSAIHFDDIHAIKTAAKKGVYIILSTGRDIKDIVPIWNQIKIDTEFTSYVIANNGSDIWDLDKNKNLLEVVISKEDFLGIHKYVKKNGYALKNSGESKFYCEKNIIFKLIKKFRKEIILEEDFSLSKYNNNNAKKLGIISSYSKIKVKLIVKELRGMFPNLEIVVSGSGKYIEINKKGISKGTASQFMADKLLLDVKETVHIGDSMNDLSAFKVCGAGVAMNNAMKDLKKEATHFTKAVGKAGVADTIRSFTK